MLKVLKHTYGIILAGSLLTAGNTQTANLNHNGFSVGLTSESEHIIEFRIPEYVIIDVVQSGSQYKQIEIPEAGTMVEEGEPYLPSMSTLYAIEPGKSYTAEMMILESVIINNIDLAAYKGWRPDSEQIPRSFSRSQEAYFVDRFPAENVMVSEPLVMRDLNMVRVSLTPFIYSPLTQRLEVITKVNVRLIETGVTSNGFVPAKRSKAFEPLYRAVVVNYDRYMSNIPYQKPCVLYILPSNTTPILATINMLLDWRERAGYEVHSVSTAIIGSQKTSIKSYILNAYNTWPNPPEHVTFVGDASGSYSIPTWTDTWSGYNGDGDHPYAQLIGNDILPEVFLGRLSFESPTELGTIVSKTIQYETNPFMGENWFTRALLVSDTSPSGVSTIFTNEYVRLLMENNGYTDIRRLYSDSSGDPNASDMVAELNDGMTFFNYRGYYGVSGFDSYDVNSLTNGFKLPIMTILTCGTGSFGNGTALSEYCLRAGNASNPKGAVAAIGTATLGTHTMFNNCVSVGFYAGVFVDGIETAGAALMRGKIQLYLTYPTNPNHYVEIFSHWNTLMGDSPLQMWTAMPQRMTVTAPPMISIGTNTLNVQITHLLGGTPVEGAKVTIRKGTNEIFESSFSDANGMVVLPINTLLPGSIAITVVKKNYIPHQSTILLSNPQKNINISQLPIIISDDNLGESSGNGNGQINPGERIECMVLLQNYGIEAVDQVSAKLTTTNNAVSIPVDSLFYGDIATGINNASGGYFIFEIPTGVTDGLDIGLHLEISDTSGNLWQNNIDLAVAGNALDIIGMVVEVVGGHLDPGEISDLQIAIQNSGQINIPNVTGTLASPISGIELSDNEGSWGTILVGSIVANSFDKFTISADENIIPGTLVNLTLQLVSDNGYVINTIVPLTIGTQEINDPMGPDDHGYYIYDSGDQLYSNAPYFDWIEINPNLGGSGTNTGIYDSGNNMDDVITLTLPFDFRMYGINYRNISICSNGWVAMGPTETASFRNYPIPGAAGPSPMIAAFWDDLKTSSSGKVYTWHDEDRQQFIIEWSGLKTYYNNDIETFQVILRNPQYYFTPTGDGEIVIQYLEFNNTSQTTTSATNHGNYSTIGIEDHTGTVGLQCTFANQWDPAAMPLQDSTAILITTKGSIVRLRGDINDDNQLDIFDVLGLIDYILAGNPSSINPYLADVNDDGVVNILDMIAVVQTVMEY